MRIFVTGASGHIGSPVVAELLSAGHEVVGFARSDDSAAKLEAAGAEVRRGDLDDLDGLAAAATDSDGVIHLAFKHDLMATGEMEAALAAYKSASDYHVAEVTTAATFETAEMYRKLGKDVMDSERPKNLKKDELEQYESLLEDQSFPFEEQSIQIHEVNTARAKDGTYDEWVQKSFAALAQLNPGRYSKAEIGEQQVDSIR